MNVRATFVAFRLRQHELTALDEARQLTRETLSAFVRRAALDQARAVIDAIQAESSGDAE